MEGVEIRPARRGDLAALTDIYNHYVRETHVTFDTREFRVEEREAWFDAFAPSGPHRLWVADEGGRVRGYAGSERFRPKPAYGTSVGIGVYVAPDCLGRGLGRRLYAALLPALEAEPAVHRAYAGVALPNPASVALQEASGFRLAGTFREVGFKFGRYWDVSWFERDLSGGG